MNTIEAIAVQPKFTHVVKINHKEYPSVKEDIYKGFYVLYTPHFDHADKVGVIHIIDQKVYGNIRDRIIETSTEMIEIKSI